LNDHKQNMNGWIEDDPICLFLKALPGFNPVLLENTRREIVSHGYPLEELPYLWNECALGDNPIGLFTHKVTIGQHSVDWQMIKIEQRNEAAWLADMAGQSERSKEQLQQRDLSKPDVDVVQDESVTADHLDTWRDLLDELRIDIQPQTFNAYVAPARPVSVNGYWTIAVPAVDWWENNLAKSLPRIYRKLTGNETQFFFVKAGER